MDGMGLHWAGMGLDRLALGWLKLGWDASGMLLLMLVAADADSDRMDAVWMELR